MLINFGKYKTQSGNGSIQFPLAYTNQPSVLGTLHSDKDTATASRIFPHFRTITGFDYYFTSTIEYNVSWLAIGY